MKSFDTVWRPLAIDLNSMFSRITSEGYFHSTIFPEEGGGERRRERGGKRETLIFQFND